MRLGGMSLENWMAFRGVHVLDFPSGAIAVVATYWNNPRRSNWAGKTAFLEAIEWCLFGTHRKRYEDDLIHHGQEMVRIFIRFPDGTTAERTKNRGKASKLVVIRDGETFVKKAATEKIVEIIGFDSDDYRATVCFAQGETAAMIEKASGERRKIVAQWLDLDPWLRVAARARANAKALVGQLTEIRAGIKIRSESLEDFDAEGCLADIDGSKAEIAAAKRELTEVEAKLEAAALVEIQRLDHQRLAGLNAERKDLREKLKGAGIDHAALDALREKSANQGSALQEARNALVDANRLLGGDFDGQCPVICAACPVPDHVVEAKDDLKAKVDKARAKSTKVKADHMKTAAAVAELVRKDRDLSKLREDYNAKTAEAKRLHEAIGSRPDGLEISEEEHSALKARKAALRAQEIEATSDLRSAEEELERGRQAREWVAEGEAEAQRLEKKLRAANLAVRATGHGGIPSAIAEASLSALEHRANGILAGTGLTFEFAWDRETKGLVTSCVGCGYAFRGTKDKECPACAEERPMKRADELEILVEDGSGVPEDAKAKSGGAKILVGSSIRLGAGMMLRDRRGARCAWAQVDEPFGALDSENREALARSFAAMLGSVGLEQAFVVSHDGSLLDALPNRIEIVRYADHSTIEVLT